MEALVQLNEHLHTTNATLEKRMTQKEESLRRLTELKAETESEKCRLKLLFEELTMKEKEFAKLKTSKIFISNQNKALQLKINDLIVRNSSVRLAVMSFSLSSLDESENIIHKHRIDAINLASRPQHDHQLNQQQHTFIQKEIAREKALIAQKLEIGQDDVASEEARLSHELSTIENQQLLCDSCISTVKWKLEKMNAVEEEDLFDGGGGLGGQDDANTCMLGGVGGGGNSISMDDSRGVGYNPNPSLNATLNPNLNFNLNANRGIESTHETYRYGDRSHNSNIHHATTNGDDSDFEDAPPSVTKTTTTTMVEEDTIMEMTDQQQQKQSQQNHHQHQQPSHQNHQQHWQHQQQPYSGGNLVDGNYSNNNSTTSNQPWYRVTKRKTQSEQTLVYNSNSNSNSSSNSNNSNRGAFRSGLEILKLTRE